MKTKLKKRNGQARWSSGRLVRRLAANPEPTVLTGTITCSSITASNGASSGSTVFDPKKTPWSYTAADQIRCADARRAHGQPFTKIKIMSVENTYKKGQIKSVGSGSSGSAPSLRDILPPSDIIEAAEKVRVWMETNGYRHRWILGGVCSRDHSERLKWWIKNAEDIAKERGELFRAGENMAAELCQWCPHEMRGEVLRAWDAAAEPIREMKRNLSPQNEAI